MSVSWHVLKQSHSQLHAQSLFESTEGAAQSFKTELGALILINENLCSRTLKIIRCSQMETHLYLGT